MSYVKIKKITYSAKSLLSSVQDILCVHVIIHSAPEYLEI